jgi:hypothetical protein
MKSRQSFKRSAISKGFSGGFMAIAIGSSAGLLEHFSIKLASKSPDTSTSFANNASQPKKGFDRTRTSHYSG